MKQENYTPGYSESATRFMTQRRAATHAAFFLPYLRAGLSLLDCGCGPGSITVDLAQRAAPGQAIGIDLNSSQIEFARARAVVPNLSFQIASVYELPFPGSYFELAFSHALFEHLAKPAQALREVRRVLKPGGIVGVCAPDWSGFIVAPQIPSLAAALLYYRRIQAENGGDPRVGGKLGTRMMAAGFDRVSLSARYECYDNLSRIGEYLAQRIENSVRLDRAIEKGWAKLDDLKRAAAALREWQARPDALFAQAWLSCVGHA